MGIKKERKQLITKLTTVMMLSGSIFVSANNQEAFADNNKLEVPYTKSIQKGTVKPCDYLNVRSGAGVSNSVVTKVYTGNTVEILEKNSNGWMKIKTPDNKVGWVNGKYINLIQNNNNNQNNVNKPEVSKPEVSKPNNNQSSNQKGKVINCDYLNVRSGAGVSHSIVGKVYAGNMVDIQQKNSNGWYKVKTSDGKVGWMSGKYIQIQSNNNNNNNNNNQVTNNDKAKKIVDLAHKQIGKPYVWGAEGPNSFDCSGLTSYVYRNGAGVKLPRTSSSQGTVGRTVSKSNLKPGDLVFFADNGKRISHVGIYIGNSKMIHSPRPGQNVRIDSINSSYYAKTFFTAKSVL